jgi:hypothetical protein
MRILWIGFCMGLLAGGIEAQSLRCSTEDERALVRFKEWEQEHPQ